MTPPARSALTVARTTTYRQPVARRSVRRGGRFRGVVAAAAVVLALAPGAAEGAAPFGTQLIAAASGCQVDDVAAGGQAFVVALVGVTDRCPVRAVVRSGTTWGPVQTIAPRGISDVVTAVGSNGDAAIAWYDAGGRLTVSVRGSGATQFGPAEIPAGSPVARRGPKDRDPPGLAVDGNGTVYAVSEDLVVHVRSRDGAWAQDPGARAALDELGALPNVAPGDVVRIGAAANAAGDLVIGSNAWRGDERFAPRLVSRRAGGTWGVGLFAPYEMADRPAVGIDGQGMVTAAWAMNDPSTGVFRAEGPAGAALGDRVRVVDLSSTTPSRRRAVDVAVAENGAAVITSIYGRRSPFAAHRPAGGAWGPATTFGAGVIADAVDAALDSGGAAAVLAGDKIFTHGPGPGRWSRAWRFAESAVSGLLAVDAAGRVLPVWEQESGGTYTVRRPFLASDTRGNTREAGPARLLSAVPYYRGGDPKRCYDALIREALRKPRRTVDPRRCAPGVAVRIRSELSQRANVRVSGADFALTLKRGTRRYILRPLRGGRHRVWLVVANVSGPARTVRLRGCPGPFC
jgi:hypothetical protein